MKCVALLSSLLLAGCASQQNRPDYEPLIAEDEAAPADEAAAPPAPAPILVSRVRQGSIDRAALDTVLDAGPAAFLAGLEVDADVDGNKFHGWRVVSFMPRDPRYAAVDIVPGDLVVRVNGRVIVRPEHFQEVWEGLRGAAKLIVEVSRGPERFLLEYAIVDKP
jgi:hypothetical protein